MNKIPKLIKAAEAAMESEFRCSCDRCQQIQWDEAPRRKKKNEMEWKEEKKNEEYAFGLVWLDHVVAVGIFRYIYISCTNVIRMNLNRPGSS